MVGVQRQWAADDPETTVVTSYVEGATTGCSASGNAAKHIPALYYFGTYTDGTGTHNEDHIFAHLFEDSAKIKLKYVPFNSGGEVTAALLGGHIDAGVMNPNEISAQVEAGKARNLAVAAHKRMADAKDVPTFAEKGYPFYWEQMRGVVGPANMAPEAVAWWQDTLKKVTSTKKWQEEYIKGNLLTPTQWVGEEANKYLDSITSSYEAALAALGGLKK